MMIRTWESSTLRAHRGMQTQAAGQQNRKRKKMAMMMMTIRRATPVQRSSSGKPRMRSGLQELETVTLTKSAMGIIDHEDDIATIHPPDL